MYPDSWIFEFQTLSPMGGVEASAADRNPGITERRSISAGAGRGLAGFVAGERSSISPSSRWLRSKP